MPRIRQALALLAAAPVALSLLFDCKQGERADDHELVLKDLAGPKTVHWQEDTGVAVRNTTFTIDMCGKLTYDETTPKDEQCHDGARVCGVQKLWRDGESTLEKTIDIAGQYTHEGQHLDAKIEWLQNGASNEDADREGFRVIFHGGRWLWPSGDKQQAIIEFLCNKNVTGNEGFESDKALAKREGDEDKGEDERKLPDLDKGKPLSFVKYEKVKDVMTLRLKWETKYACAGEKRADEQPVKSGTHWGFFTWFIIIAFLLIATYIIFGSWLNYNRYGARGWDLIPHGDTIRDLPYIIKDVSSNLMSRVRGEGGSRGGYAAV